MTILFICEDSNRRGRLLLEALVLILQQKSGSSFKIVLYCLNNSLNIQTDVIETRQFFWWDKVALDLYNTKISAVFNVAWTGAHLSELIKIKSTGIPLISSFVDCPFSMTFYDKEGKLAKLQHEVCKISDALIFRDERWLLQSATEKLGLIQNKIFFHDFLLQPAQKFNFLENDKKRRLLFSGSFGSGCLEQEIGYLKIIKSLTKQKYEVVFMPQPGHCEFNISDSYYRESLINSRFHLLESRNYGKCKEVLKATGWGLNLIQKTIFPCKSNRVSSDYLAACSSNRNYDYTEEGLGSIISSNLSFMINIFNLSPSSLVVDPQNFFNLDKNLQRISKEFCTTKYREWERSNLLKNNLLQLSDFLLPYFSKRQTLIQFDTKEFNISLGKILVQKNQQALLKKKRNLLIRWGTSIGKRTLGFKKDRSLKKLLKSLK